MDKNLIQIRHARSVKDFPFLKLEEDEYVEFAFKRARVCFMLIFGGVAAGLILVLAVFLMVLMSQQTLDPMGRNFMYILLTVLILTAVAVAYAAVVVFSKNRLFLTNKHAIQYVMKSPLATSVNIIDLVSVEDASYSQEGVFQNFFKYGTLRLSTVGDETTYTFPYSDITPAELKAVSKLISSKKQKD
jgi:hypothetical protein